MMDIVEPIGAAESLVATPSYVQLRTIHVLATLMATHDKVMA